MNSKNRTSASNIIILKRITAAVMCMMLFFVLLFTISYITLESDHDCCGRDCPVCECLEACGNALRLFRCGSGADSHNSIVSAHAVFLTLAIAFAALVFNRETPVTDKIRLNI
ncbi:MAG: hypothetical protein K5779_09205 [Saccharofermentans sp.]|nr:hypothetical protein [Saccharofermentans sp.]